MLCSFCVADLETIPLGFQHGIEFDQSKSTTSPGKSAAFKSTYQMSSEFLQHCFISTYVDIHTYVCVPIHVH